MSKLIIKKGVTLNPTKVDLRVVRVKQIVESVKIEQVKAIVRKNIDSTKLNRVIQL